MDEHFNELTNSISEDNNNIDNVVSVPTNSKGDSSAYDSDIDKVVIPVEVLRDVVYHNSSSGKHEILPHLSHYFSIELLGTAYY